MTLTIRSLAAADESDWRRLWTAYLEFYESSVPEEVYRTTFARLLDPARTQQNGLLALRDGQAAGLIHYIFTRTTGGLRTYAISRTSTPIPPFAAGA